MLSITGQGERAADGQRKREARQKVMVTARMRVDREWVDITILNVSSRGLLARTATPPTGRSYVEIRRGTEVAIIGRTVWRNGQHFGVRTQDRIDITQLVTSTRARAPQAGAQPAAERRTAPRAPDSVATRLDRSRRFAAAFQYVALAAAALAGAAMILSTVQETLVATLSTVTDAL